MFGEAGCCFERFNLACPTTVLENSLSRLDAAALGAGSLGRFGDLP